ncbi:MAG: calcium/sodium antiporter [Candidatus Micrarchaeota archaeon]
MVLLTIALLLISLIVLVVSSDKLVQSGEKIAKKLHISDFVLGVTIIAIGTTLPELATGIIATVHGDFALNWGNIVGSNIANIGLVLALSIMVTQRFDIQQKFFKPDLLALIAFTVLFIVFGSNGVFSPLEGFILVVLFIAYLIWLTTSIEHAGPREIKKEFREEIRSDLRDIDNPISFHLKKFQANNGLVLFLSLLGIWIGANGTVEYAVALASEFNVSQTIIGFTIISIGTSLPNILVALSALNHKLGDVFLGSIIGANITTIAMVGGISMMIAPMAIPFAAATTAYGFLIGITALLFFSAWVHPHITKRTAFFFMLAWVAFLAVALGQAGI